MPAAEQPSPMSGGGTVASGAANAAMSQPASPASEETMAPALFARFQKMPAASGTSAATSVTV